MIDYDIYNNEIKSVANVKIGKVLFAGECIDADSGFQQRSLVELYSTVNEIGVFNLLHIHVEDTSNSVSKFIM